MGISLLRPRNELNNEPHAVEVVKLMNTFLIATLWKVLFGSKMNIFNKNKKTEKYIDSKVWEC